MSLPLTLYTTISPTCVFCPRFHKNSRSPLSNAGSIDPDSTTTMGEGESETTEIPFQSMKAVERTSAKLRTWAASCRGCMAERPSMVAVVVSAQRVEVVGGGKSRLAGFARIVGFTVVLEALGTWSKYALRGRRRSVSCRGVTVVSCDARCPSIRQTVRLCNPPPSSTPQLFPAPPPLSPHHRTKCYKSYGGLCKFRCALY
jgi:hypothetical protein